jgi:hypothetical protein
MTAVSNKLTLRTFTLSGGPGASLKRRFPNLSTPQYRVDQMGAAYDHSVSAIRGGGCRAFPSYRLSLTNEGAPSTYIARDQQHLHKRQSPEAQFGLKIRTLNQVHARSRIRSVYDCQRSVSHTTSDPDQKPRHMFRPPRVTSAICDAECLDMLIDALAKLRMLLRVSYM